MFVSHDLSWCGSFINNKDLSTSLKLVLTYHIFMGKTKDFFFWPITNQFSKRSPCAVLDPINQFQVFLALSVDLILRLCSWHSVVFNLFLTNSQCEMPKY